MAENQGPYVFRCMSTYAAGGKETVCHMNPLVQEALGINFGIPQAPATNAPAAETASFTETLPVSKLGEV